MAQFWHHTTEPTGRGLGRIISAPFHSAASSTAGARLGRGTSLSSVWLSGALLLGGIAIGVLLSAGWQSPSAGATPASSPITRQSGREIVASTISRLEAEQSDLKKQIADLRAQASSVQDTDAKSKTTLLDLNSEINRQRTSSGLVALSGPGVIATFNDSTVHSIPQNEDPAKYILHEYDLRDILNALWIAGAEAISLNGERIVGNTSIYCVGSTVICNSTRLSPPYEIHAVGDPEALAAALQGSPQMAKFNQRALVYDLPVKIEQSNEVLVPAYNGSFVFKYATVE
ncbi:MAG: DUF881 domain-containing protein [Chloroflexota bacterium]|nr:DUF881 domain-containing protein [Chloroflexota bacterium]